MTRAVYRKESKSGSLPFLPVAGAHVWVQLQANRLAEPSAEPWCYHMHSTISKEGMSIITDQKQYEDLAEERHLRCPIRTSQRSFQTGANGDAHVRLRDLETMKGVVADCIDNIPNGQGENRDAECCRCRTIRGSPLNREHLVHMGKHSRGERSS